MSLAIYAAPFNDNNDNDNNDNNNNKDTDFINKKRQTHNKTQKKYTNESHDQEKVNSVLASIHQNLSSGEDDTLADFNPPPPPQSIGAYKTKAIEENQNQPISFNSGNNNPGSNISNMFKQLGKTPEPTVGGENSLDLNNFNTNYGDDKMVDDYYKKHLPGINNLIKNNVNRQYYPNRMNQYNNNNVAPINSTNDVLLQKINYMINLLEEQQDEKTNNVMEEVVLYSFLGIFIIFVVDSFARVGRYTR